MAACAIADPRDQYYKTVLASNTHKISKLEFRGRGLAIEAASSTNNYRDTLQLPSKRDKARERIRNQLYYSPNKPALNDSLVSSAHEEEVQALTRLIKF